MGSTGFSIQKGLRGCNHIHIGVKDNMEQPSEVDASATWMPCGRILFVWQRLHDQTLNGHTFWPLFQIKIKFIL